jgi:hypothetical protein
VLININSFSTSAAAKDTLVTIGVDAAGGTTYTDTIPTLIGSCSGGTVAGGIWYYFPLWIRAGSSIAAKAQVNNATAGTGRVYMQLFGRPKRPEMVRVGSYVDAFGISTATSAGTAITPGTTSEGAWTQLGAATTKDYWWWQASMGVNDTTMSAIMYGADLAVGSASEKRVVIDQLIVSCTSSEQLNTYLPVNCEAETKSGDLIYGRAQCSGTADAGTSMAAWALGG